MTPSKRLFDLVIAILLSVILAPLVLLLVLVIRVRDGAPVFYVSERSKSPDQTFQLWKFRTMRIVEQDSGVSGGDKTARITRTGRILRRLRLDEIPQLWNIIKGDMSFVGPRPPLARYVNMFPETYGRVLQSVPGVTGLATLVYHRTEERLLAECRTPEDTEKVYTSRCIPAKARLDLIYSENRSLCFDLLLMAATVFRGLPYRVRRR